MIREILTLVADGKATQYYIDFEKDRTWFRFIPTLRHMPAPSFTVIRKDQELVSVDAVEASVLEQAREKIREIISNPLFDQL